MSQAHAFQPFNTVADWRQRGYAMRNPPLIIASYDPAGSGEDDDALTITAREEHQHGEPWDPDFAVMTVFRNLMAYKFPKQMEFPDKLAVLLRLNTQLMGWSYSRRAKGHVICVETNGVGYAMASSLKEKTSVNVIPYVTVARITDDRVIERRTAMPRMAALDHMRVLAETHCLKIAKDAPGGKDLRQQVESFIWARPGRPEAIKGQRDDLVMSLCGALWIGSKVLPPALKAQKFRHNTARRH